MKSQFNQLTIIVLVALATMITACNGGADENEVAIAVALTQTAVSSAQPTVELPPPAIDSTAPAVEQIETAVSTPIPAIEPTAAPTAEPTAVLPLIGTTANMQGINFNYDEAAMGGAPVQELLPREPFSDGPGHGIGNPETIRFTFPNDGVIEIFAVDEYLGLFPMEREIVIDLERMVEERPSFTHNALPYLPPPPAMQAFDAQLGYIDFQNGAGIRYLTEYVQAFMPITPHYIFQGLTDDGNFYITARLPISSDALPALTNDEANNMMQNVDDVIAYNDNAVAILESLTPDQFSPSLTSWDSMLASLMVTSVDFPSPGAPVSAITAPDCFNDSEFIADVTIPDHSEIAADSTFEKVWRIKNTGNCTWTTADYRAAFVDGDDDLIVQSNTMSPAIVPPNSEAEITVSFTAPHTFGSYMSRWQMLSPISRRFGDRFYVLIDVPQTNDNQPVTDVPGYGVVRGALAYPSEVIPPLTIYFQNVDDNAQFFSMQTEMNWGSYENELPAGTYYVFAHITGDTSGYGGGYTEAVICSSSDGCDDHSLTAVTITEATIIENIDVTDWYAPVGTFPFP